jgi:hypothetical protein
VFNGFGPYAAFETWGMFGTGAGTSAETADVVLQRMSRASFRLNDWQDCKSKSVTSCVPLRTDLVLSKIF